MENRPCERHHDFQPDKCNVCAWWADETATGRAVRDALSPTKPGPVAALPVVVGDSLPPCIHRSGTTGEVVACPTCKGNVKLKVFGCDVWGRCLPNKVVNSTPSCVGCVDRLEAFPESFRVVAPLVGKGERQPWVGKSARKPWHFRTTVIIPHLMTPGSLSICVRLIRCQTMPSYIIIVDTGSTHEVLRQIEELRGDDCEIHFLRGNAYTNSSEPVANSLDLGQSRVATPYVWFTHSDVFLRERDSVEWLHSWLCGEFPVAGWEMSDRSHVTKDWEGCVSHTFTAMYTQTIYSARAVWSIGHARHLLHQKDFSASGWPDTETGFNICLREAGVNVKLLGRDMNHQRQLTTWWDHVRSLPSLNVYSGGSHQFQRALMDYRVALRDAIDRLWKWEKRP